MLMCFFVMVMEFFNPWRPLAKVMVDGAAVPVNLHQVMLLMMELTTLMRNLSMRMKLQGPLSATSSVVRGLAAFLMATSGSLNDKILGVAKFFLGIGLPGNAKDFYDQIEALACLERNRVSVPLISSLLSTIVSLTRGDQLKVKVNTVLGSRAPPLSVKLMKAFRPGSKDSSITESQELKFDQQNDVHVLDALPNTVDTGNYFFIFKTLLHDPEHKKIYVTGGQMKVPVFVTGVVKVDNAEIAVLDRDTGSIETQKKLDLAGGDALSLSANHLQKLLYPFN